MVNKVEMVEHRENLMGTTTGVDNQGVEINGRTNPEETGPEVVMDTTRDNTDKDTLDTNSGDMDNSKEEETGTSLVVIEAPLTLDIWRTIT